VNRSTGATGSAARSGGGAGGGIGAARGVRRGVRRSLRLGVAIEVQLLPPARSRVADTGPPTMEGRWRKDYPGAAPGALM